MVISIKNTLNIRLYKDNKLKINQNNIAYSKNFDKILFVVEKENYSIILKNNYFLLQKENNETLFNLLLNDKPKCTLILKEYNQELPINIEKHSIKQDNNKYTINYKLESDEEITTIEIDI